MVVVVFVGQRRDYFSNFAIPSSIHAIIRCALKFLYMVKAEDFRLLLCYKMIVRKMFNRQHDCDLCLIVAKNKIFCNVKVLIVMETEDNIGILYVYSVGMTV